MAVNKNGIVVLGAVFVDIKGFPEDIYVPYGRNAGHVEYIHGGVSRNVVEDIANLELRPTFLGIVDNTALGEDVVRKLQRHKVNIEYMKEIPNGMGTWLAVFDHNGDLAGSVWMVLPGVLITIAIVFCAVFCLIVIVRQKKLSVIKNDFINNMTHEFKTPIATISLASQMLKDGAVTNTPETIDRVATIIRDESKRLTFQVERVLQTALFTETRMKLKLKNININQLIEDLLPKFSLRVEDKGGKFSAYLEADQDEVLADEVHVTNVISNLVDNAIKYCVKPPEITIYTRNKDKEIIISVIDNGIGIAKKDQKLIFERFYRVSTGNLHDVKGFGLGLSYVKKIVEAHGGRIDVESSLDKGSCFDIILPLTVKKQKIKRTLFF